MMIKHRRSGYIGCGKSGRQSYQGQARFHIQPTNVVPQTGLALAGTCTLGEANGLEALHSNRFQLRQVIQVVTCHGFNEHAERHFAALRMQNRLAIASAGIDRSSIRFHWRMQEKVIIAACES